MDYAKVVILCEKTNRKPHSIHGLIQSYPADFFQAFSHHADKLPHFPDEKKSDRATPIHSPPQCVLKAEYPYY
ncbi:hypothetical protein [Serratia entomophila]|uniref:hypothetical protein n=1 Tax=Serratia entomophila TaxID=42906 RepID=UPI0021BB0B4C|nr:hypothetical protein [Serratia entomophila]